VQSRLLLDAETNHRLLYLSKRFGIPKTTLLRELVRAAVKDIFEVIPGEIHYQQGFSPTCAVQAWTPRTSGSSTWRASKKRRKRRNSRP
jgi:hypothetical protein